MTPKLKITSIDDLVQIMHETTKIRVLGFTTRPTVTKSPKGSGFLPYDDAVALAQQAGLPPEFAKSRRAEGDAYRLAWAHVETLKAFKSYMRRGYSLAPGTVIPNIWKGQDVNLEKGAWVDCILAETEVKMTEQEIKAATVQSSLFVPKNEPANPTLIIFKNPPGSPGSLFAQDVQDYYLLYRDCVTATDMMRWMVSAIKTICAGCMISGTGSIYFVPSLDDKPPFNEMFQKIRQFGSLLSSTKEFNVDIWTDCKWDIDEVRRELATPVAQNLKQEQNKIGQSILAVIAQLEDGKKVKSVTAPRHLAELRKLKQKAEMYKEAFGLQMEELLGKFDTAYEQYDRHLGMLANDQVPLGASESVSELMNDDEEGNVLAQAA